jgi:hypothetical protein
MRKLAFARACGPLDNAAIQRHLGEGLSDQAAARIAEGCGNWFRD